MSRTFRSIVIALHLIAPLSAGAEEQPMNVLFLSVDDLNTWLLEDENRYAGKVVAPNIQALAKTGVLFEHAYAASPVCSPSRTALWSGVRPWKSGVYHNGVAIDQSEALQKATFMASIFKEAGYYTSSSGKITHGWNQREAWDHDFPHRRDPTPPEAPLTVTGRGEQDWGPTHLKEEEMHDTLIADSAIEQLQLDHEQPFFIACGLFHPHMPWYVPQKYFDLFPLDEVLLPEIQEDDLKDVPPLGQALTSGKSKYVDSIVEAGLHRRAIQAYLATTAYSDAQIGRVLSALDVSPHRDNTIVILMSDHGFHLGEKNHWQKATLWEEATHCLLMMRVPGMTEAGSISPRFVSLQDIYPTLTELCGLTAPDYIDGRSLVPLLKNPQAPWESTAITAISEKADPTGRYLSIRTEDFRFTHYGEGQEELYDYRQDPREWNNQIGNPEYAPVVEQLRSFLPPLEERVTPLKRKQR